MTTDNRASEPSEAQVEAAAKVLAPDGVFAEDFGEYSRKRDNYRREDQAEEQRYYMRKARAALVAAQGAARPVNGFDTTAERVKTGADSLHVATQEPNQNETKSGNNFVSLDPEKVADVLNDHDYMYSTSACKCSWTGPGSHQAHQSEGLCEAYMEGKLT